MDKQIIDRVIGDIVRFKDYGVPARKMWRQRLESGQWSAQDVYQACDMFVPAWAVESKGSK